MLFSPTIALPSGTLLDTAGPSGLPHCAEIDLRVPQCVSGYGRLFAPAVAQLIYEKRQYVMPVTS